MKLLARIGPSACEAPKYRELPARFDPERYAQREQCDHADTEGLEHRSVGWQPALLGLLVNLSQSLVPEKGRINPDGQQRPDTTDIEWDRVVEPLPRAICGADHYRQDGDHYSHCFTVLHINSLLASLDAERDDCV